MNWIDYLMLALVVCSCIAGLMRGLLREIVALVTWITAVWVAWNYSGLIESHLGGALANNVVRPWVARTLIFVVVLMIGTTVGLMVTHMVRLSLFSGLDRALGGMFGFLRGLIMCGLLVMLFHALRLDEEPSWRQSLLVPYAEHAANLLRGMVGERKMLAVNSVARGP